MMMEMNQNRQQNIYKALVMLTVGIFLGIFSALISFMDLFKNFENPKEIENIIYFRGIIIGFLLISISSAIIFKSYKLFFSLFIGFSGGLFSLVFTSTYNLICDVCIQTRLYFLITFIVTFLGFVITIINYRSWLSTYQDKYPDSK